MAEQQERTFAKGLFFNKPNEKAPEFIKLNIGVRVEDFKNFLDENVDDNGFVNIDVLSKKDKSGYYGQLNDFKGRKQKENQSKGQNDNEDVDKDLPF